VEQFPDKPSRQAQSESASNRSARQQEKLDIHRLLFEHAWRMDRGSGGRF
jgi:hypothetical protein